MALRGSSARSLLMAVAYLALSDVFWRMGKAGVFWEFGKYAAAAVAWLGLFARGGVPRRFGPLVAFALLLPSIVVSLETMSAEDVRSAISFNLSGPLALMLIAACASRLEIGREDLVQVLLAGCLPVAAISGAALFRTLSADMIVFHDASNRLTSGGFGPNQVSASFGFAIIAAVMALVLTRRRGGGALLLLPAVVLWTAQAALTFSRGGIYGAGIALVVFFLRVLPSRASRLRLLAASVVSLSVLSFLIFPALDAFTHGAMEKRMASLETTGRDEMASAELDLFLAHPLLGVGPGGGGHARGIGILTSAAAHTEYTRMLGEHGVLGLVSLLIMIGAGVRSYRSAPAPLGRGVCLGLAAWAVVFMAVNAFRIAAPALALGLTFAVFRRADWGEPSGDRSGPVSPNPDRR